jgi:hypothetical protein
LKTQRDARRRKESKRDAKRRNLQKPQQQNKKTNPKHKEQNTANQQHKLAKPQRQFGDNALNLQNFKLRTFRDLKNPRKHIFGRATQENDHLIARKLFDTIFASYLSSLSDKRKLF